MARAMIYRGSSSLLHVDSPTDEVDPLELPIKTEPSSPAGESAADFPDSPYQPPDSTSVSDPPDVREPLQLLEYSESLGPSELGESEEPAELVECQEPPEPMDTQESTVPPKSLEPLEPLQSLEPEQLASLESLDSSEQLDPPEPQQDPLSSPAPADYDSSASSTVNISKIKKNRSSNYSNIVKKKWQSHQLARFLLNNRGKLKGSRLRTRCEQSTISVVYKCPICFAPFNDRGGLSKHLTFFRDSPKRISCHMCKTALATPHQLLSHRKSAHRHIVWPDAPYKCEHCPLSYSTKLSLQMHLFHYHNITNGDKPRKRKVRKPPVPSLPINNERTSTRNARKRKRAQSAIERSQSLPAAPQTRAKNRPGPKFAKSIDEDIMSHSLTSLSSGPSANTSGTNAPFVQIHAIPQEVEALLSDYEGSPLSQTKRDESDELAEAVEVKYLRSGKTVRLSTASKPEVFETKPQESDPKTEPKAKTPLKRSSLFHPTPKKKGIPMIPATRKITLLKMLYNCRECYVPLTRIVGPENGVNETSEMVLSSEALMEGTSIDLQLRNLEIALKKLESTDSTDAGEPPIEFEKTTDTKKSKPEIYRSSVCRTRFTTTQKLINHYLCFHTNSNQDECGVCRIRCGNARKLKSHLLLHCVKIIHSKQDKSPIDPRGPCEKYRKKYVCRGCKKRFWLGFCLIKHEEICRFIQPKCKKKPETKDNVIVRRTSPRKLEKKTVEIQPAKTGNQDNKTDHQAKKTVQPAMDNFAVMGVSAGVSGSCAGPWNPIGSSSQTMTHHSSAPPGYHWWDNKVITGYPPLACSICNNNFITTGTLAEHTKKFSPKQYTRCDRCGTLFPSRTLLQSHRKLTHSDEEQPSKMRCPICDQGFSKKNSLRAHFLHIHQDQIINGIDEWRRPYPKYEMKCKVCKLIFHNRKRFIEHSLYYLDDEQYKCDVCQSRFTGQFRCHKHLKTEHYSKEIRQAYTHHCSICNEGFMYQSHLHSHMFHMHDVANDVTVHGGHLVNLEDPFVCATCEQRFASIKLLDQHQNLHTNDGTYQCDKCGRKCRSDSILECHLRSSHSREGDILYPKCPLCGEGITSTTSWISHIKHAHPNSTNQPSEFCLENICSLDELIREMGVSPEIGRQLTRSTVNEDIVILDEEDNLSIAEIQSSIEFNCAICDEKFTSSQELKLHKITHGPVNYGYHDSLSYPNDHGTYSSTEHDVATETHSLQKMPTSDVISPPLETVHLPRLSTQDSSEIFHGYTSDKGPCNISIANICSVGLDEYEKLANNQLLEVTTKDNATVETTETSLNCRICHLVFSCNKTLQNHLINYSNTGDYICEVCGRRFKWLKVFRSHIRRHNKKKDGVVPLYYCEQCDEAFATMDAKHMHFAHIHNDLHMKLSDDDDDVTTVRAKASATMGGNPESSPEQAHCETSKEQANRQTIEVDLTEDEEEGVADTSRTVKGTATSTPTHSVAPLSAAVKPTVAQARVPPITHRLSQVVPNICPIICNICHIECLDVDFLVTHFANAHGIRLAPYSPNDQYNVEVQSNCQNKSDPLKNPPNYQVNSKIDGEQPSLFYYCKTCRIQFANEYSLLSHLRNAHANSETVPGKQDNWNSSDTKSSGGGERVMVGSKVQGQAAGVVSMETSFINSDNYMSNADSSVPDNAIDLTKKKTDNVVLTKIDLKGRPDRPYRILGGKNSQNIQFISLQKKDLVSLTRQRLQTSKSTEGSNIR